MRFERLQALQPVLSLELERLAERNELPRALLFSGPRGSGRLTAALDLSFSLTGDSRESLRSVQVVYLASRNLQSEVRAAEKLFLRQRNQKSRAFYIETLRRVLLQYHSCLNDSERMPEEVKGMRRKEGKAEEKEKNLFERAARLDELLMELEDQGWEAKAESIVTRISKRIDDSFLSFGRKTAGAGIDDIRKVQAWLSTGLEEKCVIFENVEDYTEGAKNSLLKLLEEPQEHSHLILVSAHPARLLETILSRVRKFTFPAVPSERLNSFFRDRFFTHRDYQSFDDFYFQEGAEEGESEEMERLTGLYYKALSTGKGLSREEEEQMFSYLEKIKGFGQFREYVLLAMEAAFRQGRLEPYRAARLYKALSAIADRKDTYNMSIRYALDLALREAGNVD